MATAQTNGEFSAPSVMMAKESINQAFEVPLADGLRFERRLFHSLFGSEDQQEGMAAFLAKRKPVLVVSPPVASLLPPRGASQRPGRAGSAGVA
ncbi:MAG TPA: enoyl-CoA hydratase-related protein [Rhizobacter sp.]|nr:enoyl-CoA hydratase-related protein [Rhizobacter sp.]